MATFSNITLAGGIKAPAVTFGPLSGPSPTAIAIAFSALSDLIAEAAVAEERLASSWAYDPAVSLIAEQDDVAVEAACLAALELLRMPCMLQTDRPLLVASRFLLQGLSLDDVAARAEFHNALCGIHPVDLTNHTRHLTLDAARMIDLAMSRLWWLFAALDADADQAPHQFSDTDALGDADPEVQAF